MRKIRAVFFDVGVTLLRAEMPAALEQYTDLCDAALKRAHRYLEGVRERLSDLDARIRTVARIGAPADAILADASEVDATLILLSTGRRAGLARVDSAASSRRTAMPLS